MNETCVDLLSALLRSGVTLTCAAIAVLLFQRFVPVTSIRLRRWMWFAVILQGCLLVRIPMTLSVFPIVQNSRSIQSPEFNVDSSIFERQNFAIVVADVLFNSDIVPTGTRSHWTGSWWGLPWAAILAVVWGVGIVGLLIRSGRHYFQFLRSLPPIAPVPQEWLDELTSLRSQGGRSHAEKRSRVMLRSIPHVGPLLCWHPRGYQLIVPTEVWRLLKPQQRLMILQHELAHLDRGDIWKSFVVRLLALPHWFNPFAWYIVNQFDDDAEHACDDAIRDISPQNAIDYARTLLLLGGSRQATFLAPRAIGGHGLAGRIRRLTVSTSRKDSNVKRAVILTGSIGISLISLLRFQSLADDRPLPAAPVVQEATESGPLAIGTAINVAPADGLHAPRSLSVTEAVVDIEVLFKQSLKFDHDLKKLKSHIVDLERSFKEESENVKQDDAERALKIAELQRSRGRIAEGLRVMEREVYVGTFNAISEEIRQYAKEHGIRLVRRRDSNPMTLANAGTVVVNPAMESGVTINTRIEGSTIVVTNLGASSESTIQHFGLADAPQGLAGFDQLQVDNVSIVAAGGTAIFTAIPAQGIAIGVATEQSADLSNESVIAVNEQIGDLPSNGTRAKPFNTIRVRKPGEDYKLMMQQDVLYAEPGEGVDITQEVLKRMNAKFQSERDQAKP